MSVQKKIETALGKMRKGQLIFPGNFRSLGTEDAIKMALSRLVRDGKLDRVAHGIYYIPKIHPTLGKLKPPLEKVAQAIASRDRVRIQPAGAYALHKLSISTQVPMKLVYVTDGPPRNIRVGNGTIKFKQTTARKLSMIGPISKLIIQALDELGPNMIDEFTKTRIQELIDKEDPRKLKHDLQLAPAWINDFIVSLKNQHDGMVKAK